MSNIYSNTFPFHTLRPRQNRRHFADDIFKCIFLNENVWIPITILLKFVPKGPINNIPALVQIMAWHRPGDKPLFEPMMINLPMHICVTRPQWVTTSVTLLFICKVCSAQPIAQLWPFYPDLNMLIHMSDWQVSAIYLKRCTPRNTRQLVSATEQGGYGGCRCLQSRSLGFGAWNLGK